MKRLVVLLFLLGCSGSGATVTDSSSDISEGRPPAVEPAKPVEPVEPGGAQRPRPSEATGFSERSEGTTRGTSFECKTSRPLSDGSIHTIRFALHGEVLDAAIEIEPQSSVLAPLAKATLERKEGKLVLTTTERAELTLFENSDLTRGYVKVGSEYSDVYCSKR